MKSEQDIRNAIEWNRYHFSFNDSKIMKPIFEYELISDGFGCVIKFHWEVSNIKHPTTEPYTQKDNDISYAEERINYTWRDQTDYASFWQQIEGIFEQIVAANRKLEKQM